MMKQSIFCVALASLTMATSCSQDDLLSTNKSSENEISFHASMGLKSRTTETTTNNLSSFVVSAFEDNKTNYMTNVTYTKSGDSWTNEKGTYFWPAEGTLNFYAYAPATPGSAGTMKLDKDAQTLTDFSPNAKAEDQNDFIYTSTTGSNEKNKEDGVSLTFKHALSWIDIKAKNNNKAYTIKITDVKLGNIINKGTFTFPKAGDASSTASWTTSTEDTDKKEYTTSVTETTLSADGTVSNQLGGNFMVIPQNLTKQSKASDGNYIAVEVTVTMQGGQEMVTKGWVYVGIGKDAASIETSTGEVTSWDMGKHYTYTLDFSEGVGQDKDGNCIFNNNEIKINTAVTAWDEANQYPIVAIIPTSANCVLMSTTQVYAIDLATKPNAFWTSAAGGSLTTAPITETTEWTAEVIWQDVSGKRIMNFCDGSGTAQTSDTYTGTGKTLYVQATGNAVGNVLIGIKKSGSTSYEDYIWSWHLWIAEDPLEIAGFMDRNLGATKGYPTADNLGTDNDETFGLFYQFGRKDPMMHDIHHYDINGNEIESVNNQENALRNYLLEGPVAIASTVKNPRPFYTTSKSTEEGGEWVLNNNYTNYYWNDINGITNATTKTFFDPCPDGWRLPTDEELKVLADNKDNFSWSSKYIEMTNSANELQKYTYYYCTYKTNLFPTVGYLQCQGVAENTYQNKGKSGYLWSVQDCKTVKESNASASKRGNGLAYGNDGSEIWLKSADTNRADGASVRCVRDKSN